jgi:NADPH2:quinone reductase
LYLPVHFSGNTFGRVRAIVIDEAGGPEVLRLRERPAPRPGPGEILVDVRVAGVNFFDTAIRGQAAAEVPGAEGAGVVAETGEGVHEFALLLQGLTAHHFATVSHPVQPGEVVLVHAAAGGVGLLLTQIAKARGATVIGLVSRPEKVEIATAAGADHVVVSTGGAFVEPVRELTGGAGVHAVFDGAGATTFDASLQVLRTHGTLVFYGPLIGDVPTIRMNQLPRSIRVTYGVTEDHIRTPAELAAHTAELFTLVEKGELVVRIGGRYPLADAARAHTDIESRRTTGKLLLIP